MVRGTILGPERAHRLDVLVEALATPFERDAERVELFAQPAGTHAEVDPATRQVIERRDGLGRDDGVALRHDQDPGAEPDGRGGGGGEGEPDQRVGQIEVLGAAGHLPALVVGVGRLVAGRHHDVLDRPGGTEPAFLGGLEDGASPLG